MRKSEIISSNRIECLAEQLVQRLFAPGTCPFERRLIVVPNEELKGYLLQSVARHLGVAAGMQIVTLAQCFAEWDWGERSKRIPSFLELSILVEAVIASGIKENIPFPELTEYLESAEGGSRRLGSLCDQLSRLFGRYGLYGQEFLPEWIKLKGWQQWIWKQIFSVETPWTYPVEAFVKAPVCSFQVHVFGFDFLPAIYASFFQKLGAQFYHFSVCAHFWEDLSSDQEKVWTLRRFKRQGVRSIDVEAWKRFSADTHPLLANWGKLSREYLKLLDLDSEQCFVEPEGKSLLVAVQKDLLLMQVGESRGVCADRSIQVHSAPTRLREVEVLYNALCDLMRRQPEIEPRDILVLSSEITAYAPFIHMVFGSQESVLSYSIHGVLYGGKSDVFQALSHLVALPQSDFALDEVMKLFNFNCVMQRCGFSVEEVALLNRWASCAHIRRGWEGQESGTWMEGIDRLLLGLAMTAPDDQQEGEVFPCPVVDGTETDLLEKWIEMLRCLHEDAQVLLDPSPRSMGEWLKFLRHLGTRYLTQEFEAEPVFEQIKKLEKGLAGVEEECFTYESLKRVIAHLGSASTSTVFSSHLEKVTFGSIDRGLMQKARVVWLLGMDEGSFPRSDASSSLCALSKRGSSEYLPKKIEEDRYAFLSALCLAQDYFIVSYERVNHADHKSQGPSGLVQELLQCLEQHYQIEAQALCVDHPHLAFDARYFTPHADFPSYFSPHFEAAQSFYGKCKPLDPFAPYPLVALQEEESCVIDIKQLALLARNPVRFFLQRGLGIYQRFYEAEHEEFVISPLVKSRVRKRALHGGFEEHLRVLKAQGALPAHAFYPVALHQVLEESAEIQCHMQRHELAAEEWLTVELSLACREPRLCSEGNWLVPALNVPLKDGREGVIVGKLDHLSLKGMLCDGKDGIADAVKYWPQFLVYCALPFFSQESQKSVLFTKRGKLKVGSPENPLHALAEYLAYYERASREISWLMPDWAEALLSGRETDFAQHLERMGDPNGTFTDEALLWLKRRGALPDPLEVLSQWKEQWDGVFQPMLSLWNLTGRDHAEV